MRFKKILSLLGFGFLGLTWATIGAQAEMLRVGAQMMPASQGNPYAIIALPAALIPQMIFDPLTRVGLGGEAQPGLAVSWTQEAPRTWIFRLRDGVMFSNGETFDAKAVVASLTYLATDEGRRDSTASQDIGKTVVSSRARDRLTLEVITRDVDPILPLHLSFVRVPAPAQWQALGRAGSLRQPVGTGPFAVVQWDENRVVLKANPTSWRKPLLDGIAVQLIADPAARIQALTSGTLDIAMAISPEDRGAVEGVDGKVLARLAPIMHFLSLVTEKDTPLRDPRVRQALNYAVNKPAIIKAFLDDAVTPEGQFSHDGAYGFDPALKPYPFDPARARALLREAGYPNGFAFTAQLDTASGGSYAQWYQQIAQDLAAVGVHMTVRSTPLPRMMESMQTGIWPVDAFAWTFAGFDSLRGYRFRSCAWAKPYHCDPSMTPLIQAADTATTNQARLAATKAALAHERENPPGIILWRGVDFDGLGKRVSGYGAENDFIRWDLVHLKANP